MHVWVNECEMDTMWGSVVVWDSGERGLLRSANLLYCDRKFINRVTLSW
jgi:hypothetical protein